MSVSQAVLDYANAAQMRVAVATRCLRKTGTLHITAGTYEYAIPDNVIEFTGFFTNGNEMNRLTTQEALTALSGPLESFIGDAVFYVFGRTLGILPIPSIDTTITYTCVARPDPLTETSEFELTGEYERAADNLALQMQMLDDGQPEVAAALQQDYINVIQRLRGRQRRGHVDRFPVIGVDPWL